MNCEDEKEFLSQLGLTFFIGQSLEFQLITLLASAKDSGDLVCDLSIRDLMNKYFLKTFGQTSRDIFSKISIEKTLIDKIERCLKARNWLIHHFYREYAPAAFDSTIMKQAKIDLKKIQTIFEETSELLELEIKKYLKMTDDEFTIKSSLAMNDYIHESKSNIGKIEDLWDDSVNKKKWQ